VLEQFKLTPERVIHIAWLSFVAGYKEPIRSNTTTKNAFTRLLSGFAFFHCFYYRVFVGSKNVSVLIGQKDRFGFTSTTVSQLKL